jgi:anti-anti-sigma factor
MKTKIERDITYTLVSVLENRLDALVAPTFKNELVKINSEGETNIIVDLSLCNYCDSIGLSAILLGHRLCKNAKGIFILTGLNQHVERLINISQLDTIISITQTVGDAVAIIEKQYK